MRHKSVYGIHSTGSTWYFVYINEGGVVHQSKEFKLNVDSYVEEEFNLIYRLVYFVVSQSFILSERTTPSISATEL
jgi:hypothetical protein